MMKWLFVWFEGLPVVSFTDPPPGSFIENVLGLLVVIGAFSLTFFLCNINPWLPILGWGGLLLITFVLALPAIIEDLRPPRPLTYHEPRRVTVSEFKEAATKARRQVNMANKVYLDQVEQLLTDE